MSYSNMKRELKESIVDSFYDCNIGSRTIVTTLAGPNLDRIANLAYNSLNAIEINSYEIDDEVFQQQLVHKAYNLEKKVADICNIYFKNIDKCTVSNFMDIDLMGTVLTQGNTVRQLLEKQSYLDGTKVFIGTFSIRLAGLKTTLSYIRNIVGLILKSAVFINQVGVNHVKSTALGKPYKYKHTTAVNKRIKQLDVYHYFDQAGPMVTFRIIYK